MANVIKDNKCFVSEYQPIRGQYLFPSLTAGESATYSIDLSALTLPDDVHPVIYAVPVLQIGDTYKSTTNVTCYIDMLNATAVIVCTNNGSSTIDTTLVYYTII